MKNVIYLCIICLALLSSCTKNTVFGIPDDGFLEPIVKNEDQTIDSDSLYNDEIEDDDTITLMPPENAGITERGKILQIKILKQAEIPSWTVDSVNNIWRYTWKKPILLGIPDSIINYKHSFTYTKIVNQKLLLFTVSQDSFSHLSNCKGNIICTLSGTFTSGKYKGWMIDDYKVQTSNHWKP